MVVVEVNGYTIEPGANLERADLAVAYFKGTNLTSANLEGTKLRSANPNIASDLSSLWSL